VRGFLRCERCEWSRIYSRLSMGRLPAFCPACGRRVVRERNPTDNSPAIAHWRAVADELSPPPPSDQPRSPPP
jgi:hypothetical protein